jgi:hypothetical protein
VVPGIDPFDFNVSQELAGSSVPMQVVGPVAVGTSTKIVNIDLEPVIEEVTVEREIKLSESATGSVEMTGELKGAIESETNALIEKATVSGELTVGGQIGVSGTAGAEQTLKFTIKFKQVSAFKLVQQ